MNSTENNRLGGVWRINVQKADNGHGDRVSSLTRSYDFSSLRVRHGANRRERDYYVTLRMVKDENKR